MNVVKLYFVFWIFVLVMLPGKVISQAEGSLDHGSIKSQFEYLTKRSNNYQEFKVVDKKNLAKLNANVLDSLNAQAERLKSANNKLDAQQKEINSLLSDLEQSNANLVKVTENKNKISLLGISMNKYVYSGLLWSIIVGLICAATFFMLQFKRGHHINSQTKKALAKTQDEFDSFRKRTLEKEQLLKRRLQDEINRRSES